VHVAVEFRRNQIMDLREVHGFTSPQHFLEIAQFIDEAILSDDLTPVPVEQPYGSLMFEES
jgi:hypothetical protein